jgi:hypothetical protein
MLSQLAGLGGKKPEDPKSKTSLAFGSRAPAQASAVSSNESEDPTVSLFTRVHKKYHGITKEIYGE